MANKSFSRKLALSAGRGLALLRGVGLVHTGSTLVSIWDDRYLRLFDRRYKIKTSGFISLGTIAFDRSRLRDATRYGPVNGWAFRRFLKELALDKKLRFADLGSGLGRACVIAAEFGFATVTGVELSPDLCAAARDNIVSCRLTPEQKRIISILETDALKFCDETTDDVFFMFRPFSGEFTDRIVNKLVSRANHLNKSILLIYSERLLLPDTLEMVFSQNAALRKSEEAMIFGQAFWAYEHDGRRSASVGAA